jgi:Brf1-like TBP-binding domain
MLVTSMSASTADTTMSLHLSKPTQALEYFGTTLKHDPDGIISLSDVDDEEIDAMILTDDERRLKKVIWNNLNRDWIKEQKQKRLQKKLIAMTQKTLGNRSGTVKNDRKLSK